MILYFPVNVKTLFEFAKDYPWIKPDRCPKCKGFRLWGHGYIKQYWFKGLRFQSSRQANVKSPTIDTLKRLLFNSFIPVTHSEQFEILLL